MMYLVAYGTPFSTNGQPVFLRLANSVDLEISVETDDAGQPDWSDASLADPRGISDTEWEMCGAFITALQAAATVAQIQAIDRGDDWMCDCLGDGGYRNPNRATACGSCGSIRPDLRAVAARNTSGRE